MTRCATISLVDPFTIHSGTQAILPGDHIDTDRIIPARFLSRISRLGYGELAFADVRGPEFVLDKPEAQNSSILVVGTNFGCGSSREHAVWAIQQAGFKCVIARKDPDSPGYSDIFRQNSANCGLLLIELEPSEHEKLTQAGTGAEVKIDLPNQQIVVDYQTIEFDINAVTKDALVKGLDLIGTTLTYEDSIASYEANHPSFAPTTHLPESVQALLALKRGALKA